MYNELEKRYYSIVFTKSFFYFNEIFKACASVFIFVLNYQKERMKTYTKYEWYRKKKIKDNA